MKRRRGLVTAVLLGLVPVPLAALPAGGAVAAQASSASAAVSVTCRSPARPSLACTLDRNIDRALRGRISAVAIGVDAPGQRVQCWLDSSAHIDSVSVVKVAILGALLGKAQQPYFGTAGGSGVPKYGDASLVSHATLVLFSKLVCTPANPGTWKDQVGYADDSYDNPNAQVVSCDSSGGKYALGVATVRGTQISEATAGQSKTSNQ